MTKSFKHCPSCKVKLSESIQKLIASGSYNKAIICGGCGHEFYRPPADTPPPELSADLKRDIQESARQREVSVMNEYAAKLNKATSYVRSLRAELKRRTPQVRKGDRNRIIAKCLKDGMNWRQICKYLLEHHHELATVKRTGKPVTLQALMNGYREAKKKNPEQFRESSK